ncbi:uncharacterized protein LOC108208124 isoform X2 [Daucus carota subsp. sativus]|uniref:uncharacterized protein LOC108208124 isoform X2 n=1 Tax=Daucus carota subsp. sativus TaxID=79200 RepID=UPI0007EFC577|nr:PREDICTED: uncharacterized protein LOC108208124 isoform X2 [Daucus carota subsp. sativus]
MSITPKFVKFIGESDLAEDEMLLPPLFRAKVSNLFPTAVQLFFRNGFNVWVGYDNDDGVFKGVGKIYRKFGLKKGQTLLFEYVSMFNFKVFIFGADLTEINYPVNPPILDWSHGTEDVKHDGGLKFLYVLSCGQEIVDEGVPWGLVAGFGNAIPPTVEFILNDGTMFLGKFIQQECKLTGLYRLTKLNLSKIQVLVFTYNGDRTFKINIIDISMTEGLQSAVEGEDVGTSVTPPNVSLEDPDQCTYFEFEIKPFHMLKYAHGVDIPSFFKGLTDLWGKNDVINVSKGRRCWALAVKKRFDYKRPSILDGWIEFRDALKLEVGDVCVFSMKGRNIREFSVQVIRKM